MLMIARMTPLARDSHVAMYRQLAQQLRESIERGDYQTGGKIPTEPQLSARFGVSRITARLVFTDRAVISLIAPVERVITGVAFSTADVWRSYLALAGVRDENLTLRRDNLTLAGYGVQ